MTIVQLTGRAVEAVVAASVTLTALTACGPPDRSAEADQLRDTVAAMPGVDDVDMRYSHDFTAGYEVALDLDMPAASTPQIGEVTSTIETAKAEDLEEYRVSADIVVAGRAEISMWDAFDPGWAVSRAHLARELAPVTGHVTVDSDHGVTSFGAVEVHDPTAVVGDVVRIAGDIPVVGAVAVADGGVGPGWRLESPPTEATVESAKTVIAGLSTTPTSVSIDGESLAEVSVELPDDPAAFDTPKTLATELGTAQRSPMTLSWALAPKRVDDPSFRQSEWEGSARIGDCTQPSSPTEKDLDPHAVELQERIRKAVGHCR